ncbi:MAG: hypothetical protein KGQ58_05250 [Proteobacteria bacterium]|nr:hypothetical protein [Pseudomonadota bacterium]
MTERHVKLEMPVLLFGEKALEVAKIEALTKLRVEGYVQPKSLKFRQLVLCAERIEMIERN